MSGFDLWRLIGAPAPWARPFLGGLLLAALLTGCGGGDTERTVPLPLAEGQPTAYTEQYLATHPEALVQPGHIVVLRHEAAADGADDTGSAHGTDEIAYHVPAAMAVTLQVDTENATLSHLVLRDDSGHELARHHRDDASPRRVTLQPGRHVLEVHHLAKGDRTVSPRAVFLRLADAGSAIQGTNKRVAAAGRNRTEAAAAVTLLATASTNCLQCVFNDSDLTGSTDFSGADLSGSQFNGTSLAKASLVGSTCLDCRFTHSDLAQADFSASTLDGSVFTDSTLQGLYIIPGVGGPASCTGCQFTGPDMDNMHLWGAKLSGSIFRFTGAYLYVIDLSNADCSGCDFSSNTDVFNVVGTPHVQIAHFQGATLVGAKFHRIDIGTGNFNGARLDNASFQVFNVANGNFPGASVRGVTFENAVFQTAAWDDADLTGATVVQPATYLAFRGSFARARLNRMSPANWLVRQTSCCASGGALDFRGTQFDGMDLSGADFSSAAARVDAGTDFAGATLSKDSSGIKLAGQNLSGSQSLAGRDLRHADLSDTTLTNTDLGGSDLGAALLRGAKLAGANLKGTRLVGAQLGVGSTSEGVAADLTDTFIAGADFTDADLRSVDLSKARAFGGASFVRARLDSALLANAMLAEVDFGSASLTGTSFSGAWLVNASFANASMLRTRLDGARLWGAALENAAGVDGLTLDDASVSISSGTWTYTEQDGGLKTYAYGPTTLGVIRTGAHTVSCPNRQRGPCSDDASLRPSNGSPFPPVPACKTDWRGVTTCN